MRYLLIVLTLALSSNVFSQGVMIDATGGTPDPSAGLEVDFADKGMLVPRMTEAERLAIANPANSLLVYQTDGTAGFYFNYGTSSTPDWKMIATVGSSCPTSNLDFTIATNVSSVTALTGSVNEDVDITLTYVSGDINPITFDVSGLPSGVTYNMVTDGSSFPALSTLKFYLTENATPGTYTVTITANCGAAPQSTTVDLTILGTKRIFISSTQHDGNMGGIAGADAICQGLADGESLGGTWMAYLATSTADLPSVRFNQHNGPYVNLQGEIVADNFTSLQSGTGGATQGRVKVDERGSTTRVAPLSGTYSGSSSVENWSNVAQGGMLYYSSSSTYNCNGYTTNNANPNYTGASNYSKVGAVLWAFCNEQLHLICVEQ